MGNSLASQKLIGIVNGAYVGAQVRTRAWWTSTGSPRWRNVPPSEIVWWILATSVLISTSARFFGEPTGLLAYVIAIGGAAGCGWAWLLTRTLFHAKNAIKPWTLFFVVGIIVIQASAALLGDVDGEIHRLATNAATFICTSTIALVFVEVLSGYQPRLPDTEKRFRQLYVGVYGVTIAICLVWAANGSEAAFSHEWIDRVIAASAFTIVVGSRVAVAYRKRHPLAAPSNPTDNQIRAPQLASQTTQEKGRDEGLAQLISQKMEQDQFFTTPDLKVATLASAIGEQEYKVTQCITGSLGFRNFNHFINSYRIEQAKQILADPNNKDRTILSIAFECGFNSIGPFNRAFKQEVSATPREFRARSHARDAKRNGEEQSGETID